MHRPAPPPNHPSVSRRRAACRLSRGLLILCVLSIVLLPSPAIAQQVDFAREVKPLLAESCYTCHGPDAATREADLRLDVRDSAVSSAIEPGNAESSELIARMISDDPDYQMPPPAAERQPLTLAQIDVLRRWIDQGAEFQQHWAYQPPRRPRLPESDDPARHPIDRFIDARLKQHKLQPAGMASPRQLVRRLFFDLHGLPPQPTDVSTFAQQIQDNDESGVGTSQTSRLPQQAAYRTLVNRLLQNQAFAERLTAYWLDVVRYGDSVGIHGDQLVSMSPYRDYVLQAFHQNMPFDQFLLEQLAGDLLPQPTTSQRVASAFNRLHMITAEGGAQPREYLAIYDADRVRNTASALLGTTMGCAQCHDHKFDPFSMREFYQFAAFFADLKEAGVYGGSKWFPQLPVPTQQQTAELARIDRQIQLVQAELAATADTKPDAKDAATTKASPQTEDTPESAQAKRVQQLQAARKQLVQQIPTVLVSESVDPRPIRVLARGNWQDESGPIVAPGLPQVLGSFGPAAHNETADRLTRLDLARWLTHPDHPLVARVFVNRLWKLMFGNGLVSTLDDFGSQGTLPTHPELLDWLAVEFIESGWDIKHIIRLIVTSEAYCRSSAATAAHKDIDGENRYLARQNRFRLDAEAIRDSALQAAGLLVHQLGGPSVRPYQPAGYYAHLNFPRRKYQASQGTDQHRRTVYTHWQRTFVHPSLLAFDAPTREECTVARPRSNTPLQSLVLLNDPIYVEAARKLAERVLLSSDDQRARVTELFQRVLQREPLAAEREVLSQLLAKHRRQYDQQPDAAAEMVKNGMAAADASIAAPELAAWTSLARVVLTVHESLMRN